MVNKSKLKSLTQSLAQNKSLLFITRSIIPFVVMKNFYTVFVVVIVWLFVLPMAITTIYRSSIFPNKGTFVFDIIKSDEHVAISMSIYVGNDFPARCTR